MNYNRIKLIVFNMATHHCNDWG